MRVLSAKPLSHVSQQTWPTPVIGIAVNHVWRVTAYCSAPAPRLKLWRIAGVGQKHSFEQTDNRSKNASFVTLIASNEDTVTIRVICAHLNKKMALAENNLLPDC